MHAEREGWTERAHAIDANADMRDHPSPGRRPSRNWFPLLVLVAVLTVGVPWVAIYGIPPLFESESRAMAKKVVRTTRLQSQQQSVNEVASSLAQELELRPSELEGVGNALGAIDAMRRAVAALPVIATSAASVASDLNSTRGEISQTSSRVAAASASIERLTRKLAALEEPWAGHEGEVRCAAGHRCASYIDAGKTNLAALMSVAACREYCTRSYPGTNFFAFHNEFGWIAFMLDPKGRCRCFDTSPCELVPDGGYNLWTSAETCTLDLLEPSARAAAATSLTALDEGKAPEAQAGAGGGNQPPS